MDSSRDGTLKKSKEVTCAVSNVPLAINYSTSIKVPLPDSLIVNHEGQAIIEIFVYSNMEKLGYNVMLFKDYNYKGDTIDYYSYSDSIKSENEYPDEIKMLLPLFDEIVNEIKFEKREEGSLDTNRVYKLILPIRW